MEEAVERKELIDDERERLFFYRRHWFDRLTTLQELFHSFSPPTLFFRLNYYSCERW